MTKFRSDVIRSYKYLSKFVPKPPKLISRYVGYV